MTTSQPSGSVQILAWTKNSFWGLLLVLVCLYPVWPYWLDPSVPVTHEFYRYMALSTGFLDAVSAGHWYPRWLPDMNGGYGYPEFVYYQPGYFFLNAGTAWVTDSLLTRQLLTVSLLAIAGGVGVYRLARTHLDPAHALLVVLAFQLSPYVHINLSVRGDLSEWMVLQLSPWTVHFLQQLLIPQANPSTRRRMMAWLGLAATTAAACYSHPIAVMCLPPLLLFLGGIMLWRTPHASLRSGAEMVCAVIAGLILSAPYWLTVATMKSLVHTEVASGGDLTTWENTASLVTMLMGPFMPSPTASFRDSGFLGAPFAFLAIWGFWRGRRVPVVFAGGLAYILLVLAMTAVGKPLWRLYPLSLLQFPWRLAVFAPVLQVLCFLGFAPSAMQRTRAARVALALAMTAMMAWSLWGHYGFKPLDWFNAHNATAHSCFRTLFSVARPGSYVATLDAGEWQPRTAHSGSLPPRGEAPSSSFCRELQSRLGSVAKDAGMGNVFPAPRSSPMVEALNPTWMVQPDPMSSLFRPVFQLKGESPSDIIVNQLYLPGWRVAVNGRQIDPKTLERDLSPDGRIRLVLPAGEWRVEASYDGPPGAGIRLGLIAFCVLCALLYWARQLWFYDPPRPTVA